MVPLLDIKGLSVDLVSSDGPRPLLRSVDLQVYPGEFLVLLGDSGAGKSTMAAILGGVFPEGLYRVQSGAITLELAGRTVDLLNSQSEAKVRDPLVGWVFQEPEQSLNPVKRVGEQLLEACMDHADRQYLMDLLQDLGLPAEDCFHKYPWQFSGGQQQRLLLAMALSARPAFLIADEPTASLDAENKRIVLEALKRFCQLDHRPGVLLITHDRALACSMGDRILDLASGSVSPWQGASDDRLLKTVNNLDHYPSSEVLISVTGLSAGYRQGQAVLKELSLEIRSGEILGITGASGCGKSSLLKAMMGVLPWQEGAWRWKGHPISAEELQRLGGLIHQDPGRTLNPLHTIKFSLREALPDQDEGRGDERIVQVLEEVRLPLDILHRKPHALSGGQKQRVAIARALLRRPAFLLCDEPFSSLDPSLADGFLELIRSLSRASNTSIIMVAHDLDRLSIGCDRILVMGDGRWMDG